MEIVVAILVFLAVVIIAALVFGGWLIVSIVRLFARLLGVSAASTTRPPLPPVVGRHRRCAYANCAASNVSSARFCRRCGRAVGAGEVAVVRRVAMW